MINTFWEQVGGVAYRTLADKGFGAAGRPLGPHLASPRGVKSGPQPPRSSAKSRLAGAGGKPRADVIDVGQRLPQDHLSRSGANPSSVAGALGGRGDSVLTLEGYVSVTLQAVSRPLDSLASALPSTTQISSTHRDVYLLPQLPGPLMIVFF